MVEYVDPQTFQHNGTQQGQNPKLRGYPTQWNQPHWNDNKYNPHLRVLLNEPDGTREYYDPVTNTWSQEHTSGYHHAICQDHVLHNIPGKHIKFVGGGGYSETISGHHDLTRAGHYRENNQGDVYQNNQGCHHQFNQMGAVSINMKNESHHHFGSVKHSVYGSAGAFGVGVGPGTDPGGEMIHDMNFGVTPLRTHMRAATDGDLQMTTRSNNIGMTCGNTIAFSAQQDHTINVQGNANTSAQGYINFIAQSNTANLTSQNANTNINAPSAVVNINGGGAIMPPMTIPG